MSMRHFLTVVLTAILSFLLALGLGGLISLTVELSGVEGWESLGWMVIGMVIAAPLWLVLSILILHLVSGKLLSKRLSFPRSTLLIITVAGGLLLVNFIAEALMYTGPEALIQIWILLQFPFGLLLGTWALKELHNRQLTEASAAGVESEGTVEDGKSLMNPSNLN